ncbi:Phosphoglycolate phosphatase [compost metagenome]
MVGDSTTDTKAAKDVGVACIVVGFGYNDVPREELGGDVVIDHYDGFEAALAEVMG